LGEKTQGIAEVNTLFFHNEGKDIAAGITGTEAVPALPLRIDEEGWVLFAMERT